MLEGNKLPLLNPVLFLEGHMEVADSRAARLGEHQVAIAEPRSVQKVRILRGHADRRAA